MRRSLQPWPLVAVLAFNPIPVYADVATQMQELFERHDMSTERAPEIQAMLDEMAERRALVSEQVEEAIANYDAFADSPAGQRMLMQDDIPYTRETFRDLVAAFRQEEAYYQWELTEIEHYYERHGSTACLTRLNQVRNHWDTHAKMSLAQFANADVSTPAGRADALAWSFAYNADKGGFITLGDYTVLIANFASSSLNCTAFSSGAPNAGQN